MNSQSRPRSQRAAAQNHSFISARSTTAPAPPQDLPSTPPRQECPSVSTEVAAAAPAALAAAAAVESPSLAGSTPVRNNRENNDIGTGPVVAAAAAPTVPTSVQVQRRRSPTFSVASSISFGASAAAAGAAAAMDIDNESTTSTATGNTANSTVIHQDDEADINQMAEADANAVGDGNDSDCEHDGGNAFASERDWEHLIDDLQDEENDDGRTIMLEGAPPGWVPPGPPDNFTLPAPKDTCPPWDEFNTAENNPGGWSSYMYQPRYTTANKYKGHYTPTGATVVPADDDGNRTVALWDVKYSSWSTSSSTPHRHGAGRDNIIPDERKGRLDAEVLEKMDLTKKRMEEKDFLFLHQLICPIIDPSKSGIERGTTQIMATCTLSVLGCR